MVPVGENACNNDTFLSDVSGEKPWNQLQLILVSFLELIGIY